MRYISHSGYPGKRIMEGDCARIKSLMIGLKNKEHLMNMRGDF